MVKIPSTVVWSDINERLVADDQGNVKMSYNIDAVKTSIDNILRTSQGERVMLPEFALGLRDLLFEPITDSLLNKLSNSIKATVEAWDNRVSVEGVGFDSYPDKNQIDISLTFRIRGYQEVVDQTVSLNLT